MADFLQLDDVYLNLNLVYELVDNGECISIWILGEDNELRFCGEKRAQILAAVAVDVRSKAEAHESGVAFLPIGSYQDTLDLAKRAWAAPGWKEFFNVMMAWHTYEAELGKYGQHPDVDYELMLRRVLPKMSVRDAREKWPEAAAAYDAVMGGLESSR